MQSGAPISAKRMRAGLPSAKKSIVSLFRTLTTLPAISAEAETAILQNVAIRKAVPAALHVSKWMCV